MEVLFICRGNAFRSRMAEAYLASLNLKGVHVVSSGTVALNHSKSNKNNFKITQEVLDKHGLAKYTKPNWDQLTEERLNGADVTVCLNRTVANECIHLFKLPENTIVWNVPDFDEVSPIPKTQEELFTYAENTFKLITLNADKLAQSIKGKIFQ